MEQEDGGSVFGAGFAVEDAEAVDLDGAVEDWVGHGWFLFGVLGLQVESHCCEGQEQVLEGAFLAGRCEVRHGFAPLYAGWVMRGRGDRRSRGRAAKKGA